MYWNKDVQEEKNREQLISTCGDRVSLVPCQCGCFTALAGRRLACPPSLCYASSQYITSVLVCSIFDEQMI